MAEIQQTQRGERNRTHQKKIQLRVDFTPMVDMNMLLVTFFMIATTMIKPQTMKITMPEKEGPRTEIPKSKAFTMFLGKNHQVYYFEGEPNTKKINYLARTNFSPEGVRKLLLNKNAAIVAQVEELKHMKNQMKISKEEFNKEVTKLKEDAPIVMIKPLDNSTYNDMVSALDEMLISNIGKYMVAKLDNNDIKMLRNSKVEM